MSGRGSNYGEWFEDYADEAYTPDMSQIGLDDMTQRWATAGGTATAAGDGAAAAAAATAPDSGSRMPTQQSASQPTQKKKKKPYVYTEEKECSRANYSIEETNHLIGIWMECTFDPVHGADTDGKAYWKLIKTKYNGSLEESWPERKASALKSHWGRVARQVKKWLPAYQTAARLWGSGKSDADIKEDAQELYLAGGKGPRFKYYDAAAMLSNNQRFKTMMDGDEESEPPAKKSRTSESEGDHGGEASVGTRLGRPIGQKATKAAAKSKGKSKATPSDQMSEDHSYVESFMTGAREDLSALIKTKKEVAESQQKIAEVAARKAEASALKADIKILAADPTNMTELARAMHAQMVKEVMERCFPNGF